MPVEEVIKVSLRGEDTTLERSLSKSTAKLDSFEKATKDVAKVADVSFTKVADNVKGVDIALTNSLKAWGSYSPLVKSTGQEVERFKRILATPTPQIPPPITPDFKGKTVDATQAMVNLSRVAQDAPFGFIGIANNLNPLLESFQSLSVRAKEAGTSIGSVLLKSLTGAGGLGIALGVVSAALSFASVGLSAWTRGMGNSGKQVTEFDLQMDRLNATLEDTKRRLDDITDGLSFSNRLGSINNELAGLKKSVDLGGQVISLRTALEDLNTEIDQLAPKVVELEVTMEAFPGMGEEEKERIRKMFSLGDVDDTKAMEGLKKTYEKVSAAYEDAVKRQATANQNLTATQLQVRLERQREAAEAKKAAEDAAKEAQRIRDSLEFNFFDRFFKVYPKTQQAAEKQMRDMYETAREFALKNEKTYVGLNAIIAAPTKEATIKAGKEFWAAYEKGLIETRPDAIELAPVTKFEVKGDYFKEAKKDIDNSFPQFEKYVKEVFENRNIKIPDTIVPAGVKVVTNVDLENIDGLVLAGQVNEAIDKAVANISVQSFGALGEAIGNALSGGGIADAFKNIGNIIGSGITALGKELIRLSGIMQAVTSAIKGAITNPLGLALAGAGLIAVGTIFKNLTIPGFATGGIVPDGFPNDTYLARLTSGERVIPERDWNNLGNMMQPQVIVLNNRLRGRDAVLQQARENRSQRRGG